MANQEMHTLLEETEGTDDEASTEKSSSLETKQTTDPEFQDVNIKRSTTNCTKESCFCILAVLLCSLVVISLVFGAGVVVGKYARDAETEGSKVECDWGVNVTIAGRSVPVLNWIDGEMKTDNIKDDLE